MTVTARPSDEAGPISEAGLALLFGAFSHLCTQQDLAGLLHATATSGRRFATPWYIGCLLRDDATDAWYVTALLDPAGQPVDLLRIHIPSGPFPFRPPEGLEGQPLDALMGVSWGEGVCRSIEEQLDISMTLCAPIRTADSTHGALIALIKEETVAPLLQSIFAHAAIAAAHQLRPTDALSSNGVLPPEVLIQRAEGELARAQRYHRAVSVLTVLLPKERDLAPAAVLIARAIRSWDFAGRLEWNRPLAIDSAWPRFAVVLPETREAGARGLIRRLKADLPDCWFGTASFPDDGGSFMTLTERACHTAIRLNSSPISLPAASSRHEAQRPRRGLWRR